MNIAEQPPSPSSSFDVVAVEGGESFLGSARARTVMLWGGIILVLVLALWLLL